MIIRAKDLARQIGVSEATISLVLNGKPGISQKTRTKVTKEIRELGYDYMLQKDERTIYSNNINNKILSFVLFKENGKLLGMNSFFPLILDGIETFARKHGYTLNVINLEHAHIDSQLSYIKDSGCSGFVIFATEMHQDVITKFESLSIPFVIFDNYFKDQALNCVKVNNEQGTFLAVKYLYEMGHRKIGYLSSGLDINSFHERQRCAFQAMEDFGLTDCKKYLYTIGYASEHAKNGMDELLKQIDRNALPTAFLADNDLVAIGALQAFKKKGYKIPEDISIIGYDDRPICSLMEPKLTTIQLPRGKFGAASVDILIQQIEENEEARITVEINGVLIKRGTVANLNNKSEKPRFAPKSCANGKA